MMHISLDLFYVEKKADQLKSRGSSTSGNPQRISKFLGKSFSEIILILQVILRAKYKKLL